MSRVYNFSPGPATLPLPVLDHARQELLNYQGTGVSILETSHRSKEFEAVISQAEERFKQLLGLGDDYRVLFLQGGASLQFAMIPYNFLPTGATADYILTGSWATKACNEAQKLGQVHVAATTKADTFNRIPNSDEITLSDSPAYVHICTNNTLYGTQWHTLPDTGGAPLVADMSSDILCRPLEANKFGIIYAGSQKNLGPAGVTVVIMRQSLIDQCPEHLPVILNYATHAKANSLYNTPPAFPIYMVNLVLGWIEEQGGLPAMEQRNTQKAQAIYDVLDNSNGYYRPHAAKDSRSLMNITFRLPDEDKEKKFISEAASAGMVGLKGHRSVGGVRASIYNAMSLEGCQALASFMETFMSKNG